MSVKLCKHVEILVFGLKIALCLCNGFCVGEHVLVEYGLEKMPARVSIY